MSFSERADLVKTANRKLADSISVPKLDFDAMKAWKQNVATRLSDIKDGEGDVDALVATVRREATSRYNESFENLIRTAAANIDKLDIKKVTDAFASGVDRSIASQEALDDEYDRADNYGQLPGNLTIGKADFSLAAEDYPELKQLLA